MKGLAFLFPGQGAQYPGMGKDFFESFPVARQTFEEADDILSFALSRVIFDGQEAQLTETRNSQAAIFVNSMAILRVIQDLLPELSISVCSGLSLGEYSALCASKRLPFAECLKLVMLRGELLNEACEQTAGSMAAVLGLRANEVGEVIFSLNPPHQIWAANYNCPGQTVISGTREGMIAAEAVLKEKGAKRIIPLQVHGAFHSGLMMGAQKKLAPAIRRLKIADSSIGFVMNVPGDFVDSAEQIKEFLTRQVTHSVRWEQGIQAMMKRGMALYVEIGCGKTLSGLNKKIGAEPSINIDRVSDLDAAVRHIESLAKVL